ncbi:4-(cytidine 5'-diphospho)-2-C-methyl-D-erythritol kinase [Georgenia sp. EYE_87]|uniref:4-(cytidine 5'-diphospho)-2-C-methyl-D-erythritol kinase n=1 Tax=Georgenia sp. EYE_87 TaxID=2853448 RepID=UPI0020043F02|nr:4-(cytidine 5'-diphospho)-2-C-methyl-D-erythritol kinase [Georgenia sp. EYE_87]MCK6211030.1 4-(cytidine 5'-diphospho)-2-C-methyl-D-erythritol kinase [Georgenia sp. EYE_87]
MSAVHVRAPGKINLALRVGPPRPDGYHPLATLFQAVSLYEDVVARPADEITLEIHGRGADLPTDGRNLAVRAAELLRETSGTEAGVHLTLTKQVPVAGGMAGGSADAAATLLACDQLWGTGLGREELGELAAELGADVPFALTGLSAMGTGRGDLLAPVMSRGQYHWVLAVQAEGLSTPAVFRAFDDLNGYAPAPVAAAGSAVGRDGVDDGAARRAGPHGPTDAAGDAAAEGDAPRLDEGIVSALLSADPLVLSRSLRNDLQEAALSLRPELGDVLAAADRAGALGVVVSGSGPTVAALALDAPHAASVAGVMRGADVAAEILTVTGPVPGARVLEHVGRRP